MKAKIQLLTPTAKIPTKATDGSAAYDIYSDKDVYVWKNEVTVVSTGIAFSFPKGYKAEIVPRSGLAFKNGITLINSPATGDSDYTSEYKIGLISYIDSQTFIAKGSRIAQIMFIKIEDVDWEIVDKLEETKRTGGMGSTGK